MNSYFLTLVLRVDQDEKERKALLDNLENKLKIENGNTRSLRELKIDLWGARDLAYPIKKQTSGFYAHFEFEADPSLAKDLDKTLKVEEDIIRFLLVRIHSKNGTLHLPSVNVRTSKSKIKVQNSKIKKEKEDKEKA